MRIEIDPMPALRADAERKINEHFNALAAVSIQQDAEHAAKRAEAVKDRSPTLEAEAALTGTTGVALAAVIMSKTDNVLTRGLVRRKAVLAARKASTPDELAAILASSVDSKRQS